ncbi:hypothetical protein AVEN_2362-1, partial [Araneus ventricosus]
LPLCVKSVQLKQPRAIGNPIFFLSPALSSTPHSRKWYFMESSPQKIPVVTKVLAAVRTVDRFAFPTRQALPSYLHFKTGIISRSNVLNVVDRNKIQREKETEAKNHSCLRS